MPLKLPVLHSVSAFFLIVSTEASSHILKTLTVFDIKFNRLVKIDGPFFNIDNANNDH